MKNDKKYEKSKTFRTDSLKIVDKSKTWLENHFSRFCYEITF